MIRNAANFQAVQRELAKGEYNPVRNGGWFCQSCQSWTHVDNSGVQGRCFICGSIKIKYCEAAPEHVQKIALIPKEDRLKPGLRTRSVSVQEAHERFEAMKKAIG